MTPTESREVVLGLSRERLARASTRLERIARDAAERILHLKQEKLALERRLTDLETLFAQERHNFEQRATLLASVASESEERTKAFTDLNCRLDDQERLLNEQIETISRLESDLAGRTMELKERQDLESAWNAEIDDWKTKSGQMQERIEKITSERDELRAKVYDNERVNAQYVLNWNADDRDNAIKAMDTLIDQLATIESRVIVEEQK